MADKTPAQIKAEEDARRANEQKPRSGATVAGAMSTYSGGSPVFEPIDPATISFTHDEVKGLVGDVERGEIAHIKLDEEGKPTGAAFRGIPAGDDVTAAVYGTPTVQFDDLVTPSGAPITKHMNPEPKLWDAGMLARNPLPPENEKLKKYKYTGGVVINTPVMV